MVIQYVGAEEYRTYTRFFPLTIRSGSSVQCDCPNINQKAIDIAEIKDGYLLTSFEAGKVYLNYLGAMEDEEGNLLVLDHPYCNEYYEYALKQRILENMVFAGEAGASQQLGLIEQRLRAARNNALGLLIHLTLKKCKRFGKLIEKHNIVIIMICLEVTHQEDKIVCNGRSKVSTTKYISDRYRFIC